MSRRDRVVLLVGGVGGAKLALGMAKVLPPGALTVVVNTADDFEHLGLHISPDVDTVMYTLAGIANPATGWGLSGDTLRAMEMVGRYGGPTWFNLGDADLGTSLMRTMLLREGHTLTEVTQQLSAALGNEHTLLPMSNDPVRTMLDTDAGELFFQGYFVRERWQPAVRGLRFEGAEAAEPGPEVARALEDATLIVFGPSNPYLSIDPILSIPGIAGRIAASDAPVVAVTPIIAGEAVKGPTAKLMHEMGIESSPLSVIHHYQDHLDGFILDRADKDLSATVEGRGVSVLVEQTYMQTVEDKVNLAASLLSWIEERFP
jgi:LPPG:FO 2-phospho-L-lactate transferase